MWQFTVLAVQNLPFESKIQAFLSLKNPQGERQLRLNSFGWQGFLVTWILYARAYWLIQRIRLATGAILV